MEILIIGLILFLGTHSIGLFAHGWRDHKVNQWGEIGWKLAYSALSLIGLALIVWGYAAARAEPIWLWHSPVWTRHLAALLTLPAFILVVATYVPNTWIKVKTGHPMILGVKVWAFAHLIANGTLADLLLFGGFLVWSIAGFAILRRRDRMAGITREPGNWSRDTLAVIIGVIAWAAFAFYLHRLLIGIAPLG